MAGRAVNKYQNSSYNTKKINYNIRYINIVFITIISLKEALWKLNDNNQCLRKLNKYL